MSLKTLLLTKLKNRPISSEDVRTSIYPDLKSIQDTTVTSSTSWTNYAAISTIVGWSNPTKVLNYATIGKLMFVQFSIVGTSNSTSTSFTLPFTANGAQTFSISVVRDNSTWQTYPGYASMLSGASTVNCYIDATGAGWTASNDKRIIGSFFLMIN